MPKNSATPDDLAIPLATKRVTSWDDYAAKVGRKLLLFKVYRVLCVVAAIGLVPTALGLVDKQDFKTYCTPILLLCFGVLVLGTDLSRKVSLRILLLRPFDERELTKSIRHFVLSYPGKIGHVYTLSDRHYQASVLLDIVSWLSRIWLIILNPIFLRSLCIAKVEDTESLQKMQGFLSQPLRAGALSFVSGGQAFNVKCSDGWWKVTVQALMRSAHIIVVDLTKVKQGTTWELIEIGGRGLLSKCVFIAGESEASAAKAVLDQHYGAAVELPVYSYSVSGKLLDTKKLQEQLRSIAFSQAG